MPPPETEERSSCHAFFDLQGDQMKPEPSFPHFQLSAKGRLPPKVDSKNSSRSCTHMLFFPSRDGVDFLSS